MNRYAMVFTCSENYWPGMNAILNALEYYEFEGVDVYVLCDDVFFTEDYAKEWYDSRLDIRFELIDFNLLSPGRSREKRWYLLFADVYRALGLFDVDEGYEVVLIWGADVLPVNNFMDYFEISECLGKVILGTNEHGTHGLEKLQLLWPYKHHWNVPYADVPFFVPQKHKDLLQLMLDYQGREGCQLSHMDGLNYAIKETGAGVFEVPGELWVQNVPYMRPLYVERNRMKVYFKNSSTQLFSVHRKYWNPSVVENYLTVEDGFYNKIGLENKRMFGGLYKFFNEGCRVKIEKEGK